jgi:hypothetical protein
MEKEYQDKIESIIHYKNEYIYSKNNNITYDDDGKYFKVAVANLKIKLKKRKYFIVHKRINEIKHEINKINTDILSMRKLFMTSNSDIFSKELIEGFDYVYSLKNELIELDKIESLYSYESKQDSPEQDSPEQDSPKQDSPKQDSPKQGSPKKHKKNIKNFLFETYKQCASGKSKSSEPYYMSKKDLIAHITNFEPNMLNTLPKNFASMKKSEICKVIFS